MHQPREGAGLDCSGFGNGALAEGVPPRGQPLRLRQGISVQDDVPAGELGTGMLRVRQAFRGGEWNVDLDPGQAARPLGVRSGHLGQRLLSNWCGRSSIF